MPDKKMSLAQKILLIRESMPYFQKEAQGFGYKYVAGCGILETFRAAADRLGVLLIPEIRGSKLTETRIMDDNNKEKIGRIIELDMNYVLIDTENEDPETNTMMVPFKAFGEQRDSSKAFGSALTYAERYFLLKFFNVPTDLDDPDSKGIKSSDLSNTEHPVNYSPNPNPPQKETKTDTGDKLIKSHYISQDERDLWNQKKGNPASHSKGISYLLEKIRIGEHLENTFYMSIMASGKDLTKAEAKTKARDKIEKEYTPLDVKEAKEKFKEDLE